MPQQVKVELGDRSYLIHIGPGLLAEAGRICRELGFHHACMIVTDTQIDPLYGETCRRSMAGSGMTVATAVVPAGEGSKSQKEIFGLYDRALAEGLDRSALIVALGGGVVGDLAGYMAASYLRGIHCVQVPTTLLAMVDSSVGGKTGINLPQGKNLVGAFHQPAAVIADLDTLKTLPRREYVSGLAEVVKYGVIRDAEFFVYVESHADALLKGDPAVLETVIARCCAIKADVVRQDEREGGLRAILNFGHTLAHALEQASGYGTFLHGEAVAVGMAFAAKASVVAQGFPEGECARVLALLMRLGLPVDAPGLHWKALRAAMDVDKKTSGGIPRFVLAEKLGSVKIKCDIWDDSLREIWESRS